MKKVLASLGLSVIVASGILADTLMMATTTSTEDTGLLDYLAPQFEKQTGTTLKWVSTGTGKVMYNDFVIIGPINDPANVSGKTTAEAFKIIKEKNANFLSRGDNSGTHQKELSMWEKVSKIVPEKDSWYVQTGQGMIATINMASEKGGYTLTDRGTWIKYESQKGESNNMKIIVENDNILFNQYSVITVNKDRCPKTKTQLSKDFTNWIIKDETQKLIGDFKLLEKPLFTPNAKK